MLGRVSSLWGSPPEEFLRDPAGALRELCGTVTGYDLAPQSGRPVSFRPNDLSIPSSENVRVSIADLWDYGRVDSNGSRLVDCFSKTKILPETVAAGKLTMLGLAKCYSDPLLRVPRVYANFLKSLQAANCIEFSTNDDCHEFVECFFVAKKMAIQISH